MTPSQISSGLSAPFGAAALLGQNGAIALLLTLFMAVTSSSSAELIAVSSILTFDVYKTYFVPKATPQQLIFISHVMICVFGVIMAAFACLWHGIGIDLGWLFLVMGLIIGGAVFPAAFAICWKGQTKAGAISGCLVGLAAGLIAWLVEAQVYYGELTIATTGASYPTLAGNMAAVLTGLVVSLVVSLIKPDDFDWSITRAINAPTTSSHSPVADTPLTDSERSSHIAEPQEEKDMSTSSPPVEPASLPTVIEEDREENEDKLFLEDPRNLKRAFLIALVTSSTLTAIMLFILPMPMFFTEYVFSQGFFTAWIVISFLWVFFALGICGLLPVWETRAFWGKLGGAMFGGLRK